MARNSGRFRFDGGAGTYLGTGILAVLVTVLTLGICYPFALVLKERWRAKHSYIDGQRLTFTGSAVGLFGNWIKWLLLGIITAGIYLSGWVRASHDGSGSTPTSTHLAPEHAPDAGTAGRAARAVVGPDVGAAAADRA